MLFDVFIYSIGTWTAIVVLSAVYLIMYDQWNNRR